MSRVPLHPRELRVLFFIAQGLSNKQIAARMGIAEPSVRTHISNILPKLGVKNRTQAALYAWRAGIVDPDEAWQVVDGLRRNTAKEGRQL